MTDLHNVFTLKFLNNRKKGEQAGEEKKMKNQKSVSCDFVYLSGCLHSFACSQSHRVAHTHQHRYKYEIAIANVNK